MEKNWILIANAEHAHCFERQEPDHSLRQLIDFEHPRVAQPSRAGKGDPTGDAGKGHGRTAHAGTQFEPHTEARAKERAIFARQIADYLNEAVATQRCTSLVLIATSSMLGALRACLGETSNARVRASVAKDLTHYIGPELERRVNEVLQLPNGHQPK